METYYNNKNELESVLAGQIWNSFSNKIMIVKASNKL